MEGGRIACLSGFAVFIVFQYNASDGIGENLLLHRLLPLRVFSAPVKLIILLHRLCNGYSVQPVGKLL